MAFVLGFAAMLPFMNTYFIYGLVARKLDGADIAFYVGFIVTGILYYVLRKLASGPAVAAVAVPAVGVAGEAGPGRVKE